MFQLWLGWRSLQQHSERRNVLDALALSDYLDLLAVLLLFVKSALPYGRAPNKAMKI